MLASSSVTIVVEAGASPSLQLHGTDARPWRSAVCESRDAELLSCQLAAGLVPCVVGSTAAAPRGRRRSLAACFLLPTTDWVALSVKSLLEWPARAGRLDFLPLFFAQVQRSDDDSLDLCSQVADRLDLRPWTISRTSCSEGRLRRLTVLNSFVVWFLLT